MKLRNLINLKPLKENPDIFNSRGAVFPKDHPQHNPDFPGIEGPQGVIVNGKEVDMGTVVIDGVTPEWGMDDGTSDAYAEEAYFVDGTELTPEELEILTDENTDEIHELAIEQYFQGEGVGEGSCGYTHTADGKELNTPGGTRGIDADKRTMGMMREFIKTEMKKLFSNKK